MITFNFNYKVYCGYHDWLTSARMNFHFDSAMVKNSYSAFPHTSLDTNQSWDDFCGMYLMGGEL